MRLVLDTNVLIAAFITRGACNALFERCARLHTIVGSEFILGEFRRHLLQKFRYPEEQADAAVELVRSVSEIVNPEPLESPACRDPDDDVILATAVSGGASCIVTGDKDLLDLGSYRGIAILRPGQFEAFESAPE